MPRATKAMALTESFKKMKHPKWLATSPMTAVQTPIMAMEMTKQGYPPAMPVRAIAQKKGMIVKRLLQINGLSLDMD